MNLEWIVENTITIKSSFDWAALRVGMTKKLGRY